MRALITSAHDILQSLAGPRTPTRSRRRRERIFKSPTIDPLGFIPCRLVQGSFDTLSSCRHTRPGPGVPTGFNELDEMTAGLSRRPGHRRARP